jgi:hypothetical protein
MSHVWKMGFSNFFTSPSRPTESIPYKIYIQYNTVQYNTPIQYKEEK